MVNYYLTKKARTYNGAKTVYSINDVGKTGQICAKKKIKRKPTEQKNIFTNTADKGLISKIYKVFTMLITETKQNKNNPIKKWTKDLNIHFSKEDIQMADRRKKRYPMSLIIRKMQIKTTMGYHLIPVRMAIINKLTNSKC